MTTKLVIFGATGNVGSRCLHLALSMDYDVTVLVRDATRLKSKDGFKIVVGDVLNLDDVRKATEHQELVLVVLGTHNNWGKTVVISQGTKNILRAMGENDIKRIIVCNSAFMFWPPEKVLLPYRGITADHRRQIECLQNSWVDWIAVCPPRIYNEPPKGKCVTMAGSYDSELVSREDLADFLVRCLQPDTDRYLRQLVGISDSVDTFYG